VFSRPTQALEALLVATGIKAMPSYNEIVKELAKLGLLGSQFTPERYADALAAYTRSTIGILTVSELTSAGEWATQYIGKAIHDEGFMGETAYFRTYPGSKQPHFLILIADDLPWDLQRYTIFHELAHIASCHGFIDAAHLETSGKRVPQPPAIRRLAERRPFSDHGVVEEEANLRARYSILAADAGRLALDKDSLNQVH
jgi:hypothetical protein